MTACLPISHFSLAKAPVFARLVTSSVDIPNRIVGQLLQIPFKMPCVLQLIGQNARSIVKNSTIVPPNTAPQRHRLKRSPWVTIFFILGKTVDVYSEEEGQRNPECAKTVAPRGCLRNSR